MMRFFGLTLIALTSAYWMMSNLKSAQMERDLNREIEASETIEHPMRVKSARVLPYVDLCGKTVALRSHSMIVKPVEGTDVHNRDRITVCMHNMDFNDL